MSVSLSPQPMSDALQRLKPMTFSSLFRLLARFLSCYFLFHSVLIGVIGFPYQTFAKYLTCKQPSKPRPRAGREPEADLRVKHAMRRLQESRVLEICMHGFRRETG